MTERAPADYFALNLSNSIITLGLGVVFVPPYTEMVNPLQPIILTNPTNTNVSSLANPLGAFA
jgi:hypothetical protein